MAERKEMEIQYSEVDFEAVAKYFIKDFKFEEGRELWKAETYYDPKQGKVIFKLFIIDKTEQ